MRKVSLMLALVVVFGASMASAASRTVSNVSLTAPKLSAKGGSIVQYASVQDLGMTEGQEISFAEMTFEESLDPRTEVEIWPAVEGETEPWDVPEIVSTFGRNLWVADDRTGSFVKFDVTAIMKAWESETLANHGFEFRVLPEGSGEEQGAGAHLIQAGAAPKATLRIFTHPTRPLTASQGSEPPKILPVHGSKVQDGAGGTGN